MPYVDTLGFPTSTAAIAQEFWQRMAPDMRMRISRQVPAPKPKALTPRAIAKRDLEVLRACHAYVAQHLLEFHADGNVLTATLKAPVPAEVEPTAAHPPL